MTIDKKSYAKILGENLERIRKARGYSRQQLADVMGITENNFGSYERGRKLPPLDRIIRLAKFLDVSIIDLTTDNPNATTGGVFQYRLKRAYRMASDFLDSLLNYEPNFDKDGHIVIHSPVKMEVKYENGNVTITHKTGYNSIAFQNEQDFIQVMEQAEWNALKKNINFNAAFREIIFNEKPE